MFTRYASALLALMGILLMGIVEAHAAPPPVITSYGPSRAVPGDVMTIGGRDFGPRRGTVILVLEGEASRPATVRTWEGECIEVTIPTDIKVSYPWKEGKLWVRPPDRQEKASFAIRIYPRAPSIRSVTTDLGETKAGRWILNDILIPDRACEIAGDNFLEFDGTVTL